MTPLVTISIIICTYNRAEVLAYALESFLSIEHETVSFEIVIVDNNSNDMTKEIFEQFKERFDGSLKYFFEGKPGLSNARNSGVKYSTGEIVAFVDDDVEFSANWLCSLVDCFDRNPDVWAVGGKIIPVFIGERPDWVVDEMLPFLGLLNLGEEELFFSPEEHPFGGNMAFRRAVFDECGYFNPKIGFTGASLISNEEKAFFSKITDAGGRGVYSPEALLYHRVFPSRLNVKWMLDRYYNQGVSDVIIKGLGCKPTLRSTLSDLYTVMSTIKRLLIGESMAPKKLWWHVMGGSLIRKAKLKYAMGVLSQTIKERI